MNVKIVAFDADDTLWHNQLFFDETEQAFCRLIAPFASERESVAALFATEMKNMQLYGYGVKASTLSMIETAIKISKGNVPTTTIEEIINLGKALMDIPIRLMGRVAETLQPLSEKYKLIVVTKGDLLEQKRKLHRSGIDHFFHHVEIMSDKTEKEYRALLETMKVAADDFLMIGNSLKSDILPVLHVGGYAVHIPCERMWQHEVIEEEVAHLNLHTVNEFHDLLGLL